MNIEETSANSGKLYLVSTPIGNKDDISVRAINTIKRCDLIVCEEMKMGALTLKNLNLAKELIPLNENNESEMTPEILKMLKAGKKIALISDAGTPVFADPGLYLVRTSIANNIEIEVVPGASSIMTAIVRSGFDIYEFLYAGFLPRKNEDRDRKIQKLARERRTVLIMETPYRFNTLIEAIAAIIPDRKVYIGMNLTMPFETHHYGTFAELAKKFENSKIKSEFVLVMEANKEWLTPKIQNETEPDFDDYDDDEDEEYEYPVKAHIKPVLNNKKKIILKSDGFKRNDDFRENRSSGGSRFGERKFGDKKFSDRRPGGRDFKRNDSGGGSRFSKFRKSGDSSRSGSDNYETRGNQTDGFDGIRRPKSTFDENRKPREGFSGVRKPRERSDEGRAPREGYGDSRRPREDSEKKSFSKGNFGKRDFSDNRQNDGRVNRSSSSSKFKGKGNGNFRGKR